MRTRQGEQVVSAQPAAVHDEMAASIENTLLREGRRNERTIAQVRMWLLLTLSVIEIYFATTPGGISFGWRLPTFGFLLLSVVLFQALKRGYFHPAIPLVIPFLDIAFGAFRFQATFSQQSIEALREVMELGTVIAAAAVLILSGAYRLRSSSLLTTIVLGLLFYVWFGVQSQVPIFQMATHLVLLLAVGGMAWGLTGQVKRAVRSEVARQTLARFLPASVIEDAHQDPLTLLTQPRSVDASVLTTDIRGFTSWAEHEDPIAVLGFLNIVQGALAETVRKYRGTVDKFMGDGMLAVFGAPELLPDHADQALAAAREMQQVMVKINENNPGPDVRIGIGLHAGELVVGCLGSGVRMEFTVLGDTVNTSSRLESMTKERGVDLLISADAVSRLSDKGGLREEGEVRIRGRQKPLAVWTPVGGRES